MTKTPTPASHAVNTAPISADLQGIEQTPACAKLVFVNGAPAACGCRHEFSSGGGEYSDVAYVHLCQTHAGAAPCIVLDGDWRFRMLDGAAIERDEMGCGEHPALPVLEEGMKPKQFFDALGIELAGVMAEDQMDMDAYEAMTEAVNYNVWTPEAPKGDGWTLVAIFDTEDGPAAWWMREAAPEQPARKNRKAAPCQAQQDAPAAVAVPEGFFSYCYDDGFTKHDSIDAAKAASQEMIDMLREEAGTDEWPGSVGSVCYGVIVGQSTEVRGEPGPGSEETADYVLLAAAPAAPASQDAQDADARDADRWRAVEAQVDSGAASLVSHNTDAEQWDGRTITDAGELQDYADAALAAQQAGGA